MQPFSWRWLIPVGLVVSLLCSCSDTADDTQETTAAWLAEIIAVEDPFFHGFALSGPTNYPADEAECIAPSILQALDTPATRAALTDLEQMALSGSPPLSQKIEAVDVFTSLPREERIRIGGVALDAAQQCGDLRLNLYAAANATAVCVFDHADDETRERIVAYSLQGRAGSASEAADIDEKEFEEAWPIFEECWTLLQAADENNEVLEWVEDLGQRLAERFEREDS